MIPETQCVRTLRRALVAVLGCLLALGGGLIAAPVSAAPLHVTSCLDDGGAATLRGMIGSAVAAATIVFDQNCTGATAITLASARGTLTLTKDVTIDGTGHTVVVDGGCTASCGTTGAVGGVGVFTVNTLVTASLTALTIQHGHNIIGCDCGGGVYNNGGTLSVTNSTLSANSAGYAGGGIYNIGTLSVTNSTISGNGVLQGGGIYNNGSATVTNSTISGNSAGQGGGGINSAALPGSTVTLTVTNSTITGNSSTGGGGGGINSAGLTGSTVTVTVTNSTFTGNSSTGGGAILNGGTATVTNSTFTGNSATTLGGGGILNGGALAVTNSTITGNSSTGRGGGGITTGLSSTDTVTLTNTLLAANTGTAANCNKIGGTLTDGGYNLEFNPTTTCGFSAGNHAVFADPLFGTFGNYGGPTQTIPLLPGSPAIDAGGDLTCAATGPGMVNSLDQRGVSRTAYGAHCDIGAVESHGFVLGVSSGSNQTATVSTAFSPLSVLVTSGFAEPVVGGVVTFTPPAFFAGIQQTTPLTATIGGGGVASITPSANATAGSYIVYASAAGGPPTPLSFSLANAPLLSGISPAAGATAGTNTVTLTGAGFGTSPATIQVRVGGTAIPAGSIVSVTNTTIVYVAPAHAAGPVTVGVSVGGVAAAASMGYTYVTVTALPPPQLPGPAGGPPNPLPVVRPPGTTAGAGPNSLPARRP